jgi:predicted transcriptional regulator
MTISAREIIIEETGCDAEQAERAVERIRQLPKVASRALGLLRTSATPLTTTELVEELGEKHHTVLMALRHLRKRNKAVAARAAHGTEYAWAHADKAVNADPGPTLRSRILDLLTGAGALRVQAIAEQLGAEVNLVRTSLASMALKKRVERVYPRSRTNWDTFWRLPGCKSEPPVEARTLRVRILVFLKDGRTHTARGTAEALGANKGRVSKILSDLVCEGLVERAREGHMARGNVPGKSTLWRKTQPNVLRGVANACP